MSDRERYEAAMQLGAVTISRRPRDFARWLKEETDWTVSVVLLERLARAVPALAPSDRDVVIEAIEARADDDSFVVRAEALDAVRFLGLSSAIPLARLRLTDASHVVRGQAARTIEALGGPDEADLAQRIRSREKNLLIRHRLKQAARASRKRV